MRLKKAHKDQNHDMIVEELEDLGYSVQSLHMVGGGVPDLIVGMSGETFLVELKSETRQYNGKGYGYGVKGRLEDSQIAWIERWQGGPVIVACTTEEVLAGIEQQLDTTVRTVVN